MLLWCSHRLGCAWTLWMHSCIYERDSNTNDCSSERGGVLIAIDWAVLLLRLRTSILRDTGDRCHWTVWHWTISMQFPAVKWLSFGDDCDLPCISSSWGEYTSYPSFRLGLTFCEEDYSRMLSDVVTLLSIFQVNGNFNVRGSMLDLVLSGDVDTRCTVMFTILDYQIIVLWIMMVVTFVRVCWFLQDDVHVKLSKYTSKLWWWVFVWILCLGFLFFLG